MFIYLRISVLITTILLSLFLNFIHLSEYKFKKYLKLFFFFVLFLIVIFFNEVQSKNYINDTCCVCTFF